jgi:hypothetical protein
MFKNNSLSYKKLNEELIKKIKEGDINEKTILNSTNYIKKEERVANGIFYTPLNIVDETYKYLDNALGVNWKKRYTVWDSACGKGNLTKQYEIDNLFLSTLEKTDLDFIEESNYNENAIKFQFDFLNDDLDKAPKELLKKLKDNKPILFLINPPYANNKNTNYSKKMKEEEYSHYVYRLTHFQFLYRILDIKKKYKLTNISICFIAPLSFLSKKTFRKFREDIFSEFKLEKSFVFDAKEFNVKHGNWLIGTTILNSGSRENIDAFEFDIYKSNKKKTIYNIREEDNALKHLKRFIPKIKKLKHEKTLPLKSALNHTPENEYITRSSSPVNCLGYYVVTSNNVDASNYSFLLSSQPGRSYGLHVVDFNLKDVVVNFVTRKAVKKHWLNSYDEYYKPDPNILKTNEFKLFENDSIIHSLFSTSSHQSSLRGVEFRGEKYNVLNNWFWLSKDDIEYLARQYNYKEMLIDLEGAEESFIYKKIQTLKLSSLAKDVLRETTDAFERSFRYRKSFDKKNPERHLHTWDAGWQQLKPLIKEHSKRSFKRFLKTYGDFEKQLRDQVYAFNLLK